MVRELRCDHQTNSPLKYDTRWSWLGDARKAHDSSTHVAVLVVGLQANKQSVRGSTTRIIDLEPAFGLSVRTGRKGGAGGVTRRPDGQDRLVGRHLSFRR